jgi:hypothetical protein
MTLCACPRPYDILRIELLAKHSLAQRPQLLCVIFIARVVFRRNDRAFLEVSWSFLYFFFSSCHVLEVVGSNTSKRAIQGCIEDGSTTLLERSGNLGHGPA